MATIRLWQFPTLAWGDPTLPSALRRFTSEFGMGSGGTTALLPPGKFCFIRPLLRSDLICIRLKIFSHPPKQHMLVIKIVSELPRSDLLLVVTPFTPLIAQEKLKNVLTEDVSNKL